MTARVRNGARNRGFSRTRSNTAVGSNSTLTRSRTAPIGPSRTKGSPSRTAGTAPNIRDSMVVASGTASRQKGRSREDGGPCSGATSTALHQPPQHSPTCFSVEARGIEPHPPPAATTRHSQDAQTARQPSILDRIEARLFPTPSGLDPVAAHQLQRQGLLQIGTALMRSGGAAPYQRGTLANIGGAIGGVDLSGMVNNALAVQAYQKQQADQAKQEAFLSSIKPPMPGQDLQGWIESVASQPDALRYPAQVKNLLELHQLLQDKKGAGDWQPYANPVSGEMYRFNKRSGKLEPAGAVGQSKLLAPAAKPSLTPAELGAAHQVVTALTQQNALEDQDKTAGVTPA